jgi:phosphohistidine phosphatase SixA
MILGVEDLALLLYLIRHAEAGAIGSGGVARDFDRPLTARGRDDSRRLAQALANRRQIVDAVVASPLVRAHQTAVELLAVLAPASRPITCDELALERLKPGRLSDFLAHVPPGGVRTPTRDEKAVIAVGHMPDLGAYLEWLVGAAPGTLRLAKAGAACVRFRDEPAKAAGELLWLLTPEWY